MDTVDGVPHVLPGGDEEGEGEAGHDGDGVVEPEDAAVYLDVGELYQTLQSPQKIQHLVSRSVSEQYFNIIYEIERDFVRQSGVEKKFEARLRHG